jgi:cyclopropane fatty-acyl-phospholipid synthase-like methyltransferase
LELSVNFKTLRDRFFAWWGGYEFKAKPKAPPPAVHVDEDEGEDIPAPSELTEWTPQRIRALQMIFGPGEDSPAASERCKQMIVPLGLNAQMSVVEIGCKLGAGLRVVAGSGGAWIDGVEAEECFIDISKQLIARDGLQKKAVPMHTDLADERIQKHRRDVIISRESLHRFDDRKKVLEEAHDLLKPQGQMVFTDFVMDPMMDETDLDAWLKLHLTRPNLVQLEELRSELIDVGFDVHVARDESAEYCTTIVNELLRFAKNLKRTPTPKKMNNWVMMEVEYWARTLTALESGALQLARFHVMKTFDDPFA